jgi:SAM-dependent methyltransferase
MTASHADRAFAGSIPQLYERYLVPLIFEPYADDLVERVRAIAPARVLEIAAGTGVVTRRLAAVLVPDTSIMATDLNPPMLEHARALGTARPVDWQQADAMALPFADQSFDAVVCQFGVMFFPDRATAFAEARRVLRPGGTLLFNVWDRLEANDFADTVTAGLAGRYPADPPRFLARTPHGYCDIAAIARDVAQGGFAARAAVDTVARRSRADAPSAPAIAYCQGTPLRGEIEARDACGLAAATEQAAQAIARRFGPGPVEGGIRAHVVTVVR